MFVHRYRDPRALQCAHEHPSRVFEPFFEEIRIRAASFGSVGHFRLGLLNRMKTKPLDYARKRKCVLIIKLVFIK